MNLSQFIKTTLSSIKNGVVEANKEADGAFILNPSQDKIDFDVAVEVSKEKSSEKGGGIAVKVVEGKISGSSKSSEASYSRIKFSVSIRTTVK